MDIRELRIGDYVKVEGEKDVLRVVSLNVGECVLENGMRTVRVGAGMMDVVRKIGLDMDFFERNGYELVRGDYETGKWNVVDYRREYGDVVFEFVGHGYNTEWELEGTLWVNKVWETRRGYPCSSVNDVWGKMVEYGVRDDDLVVR